MNFIVIGDGIASVVFQDHMIDHMTAQKSPTGLLPKGASKFTNTRPGDPSNWHDLHSHLTYIRRLPIKADLCLAVRMRCLLETENGNPIGQRERKHLWPDPKQLSVRGTVIT